MLLILKKLRKLQGILTFSIRHTFNYCPFQITKKITRNIDIEDEAYFQLLLISKKLRKLQGILKLTIKRTCIFCSFQITVLNVKIQRWLTLTLSLICFGQQMNIFNFQKILTNQVFYFTFTFLWKTPYLYLAVETWKVFLGFFGRSFCESFRAKLDAGRQKLFWLLVAS